MSPAPSHDCPKPRAEVPLEVIPADVSGQYWVIAIAESGPSKGNAAEGLLRLELDRSGTSQLTGATSLEVLRLGIAVAGWTFLSGDSLVYPVQHQFVAPGIQLEIGGGTLIHGGVTVVITERRQTGFAGYWSQVDELPVASGYFCLVVSR